MSVLPLSIMLEVAGGRDVVRRLLGWTGRPYLVLRLTTVPATDSGIPRTPRLSPEQIIHRR